MRTTAPLHLALVVVLAASAVASAQTRDLIVEPPTGQGSLDPYDLIRAENPLQEFEITLEMATGEPRAQEGETVRFVVRSDRAGYVTLLNKSPEGTVTFLYPNRFSPAMRIAPGEPVTFPASEQQFRIRVSAPFGQEYVKAIVTPEPLVDETAADWGSRTLVVVEGTPETDGGSDLGGFDPSLWGTADLRLDTYPQGGAAPPSQPDAPPAPSPPAVAVPPAPPARYSGDPQGEWHEALRSVVESSSSRSLAAEVSVDAAPSSPAVQPSSVDEIVVIYRPDAGTRAFGTTVGRRGAFGSVRVVPADASAVNAAGTRSLGEYGATAAEQIDGLNADPDVLAAFPNLPVYAYDLPKQTRPLDPATAQFWELQWGLHNGFYRSDAERYDLGWLGALRRYRAPARPLVVAVIDSGVHLENPALRPVLWKNEQEIPGNGRDDDANGYVDDVHGWDTYDDDGDPTDPQTDRSHGTFVASQIVYDPDAPHVYGLAPDVRVMPVRALGPSGGGTAGVIGAILYAVQNGADVINMSLGTGPSSQPNARYEEGYRQVFAYAARNGVLIVTAAGNDTADSRTTYTYPAAVQADNALSVAALSIDGRLAPFSNHGPRVDLAAPGASILGYQAARGGLSVKDGTSMAAPYVAAAAAMLWSQHPDWGPGDVKERLVRTVTRVPGLDVQSGGTVNLDAAMGGR